MGRDMLLQRMENPRLNRGVIVPLQHFLPVHEGISVSITFPYVPEDIAGYAQMPWHGFQESTQACNSVQPVARRHRPLVRRERRPVREVFGAVVAWWQRLNQRVAGEVRQVRWLIDGLHHVGGDFEKCAAGA